MEPYWERSWGWQELYRVKDDLHWCICMRRCCWWHVATLIMFIGGVVRDGKSAANRLENDYGGGSVNCQTTQPNALTALWWVCSEEFIMKCSRCVKTGAGYPAIMNNRIAMEFLINQYGHEGMTVQEAFGQLAVVLKLLLAHGCISMENIGFWRICSAYVCWYSLY